MSLPIWIKTHLKTTKGLTQAGLAEQLGVAPSAVSRMLNGERKIKVDELPVIETYIGARYVPASSLPPSQNDNLEPEPLPPGIGEPRTTVPAAEQQSFVPVYGYAAGSLEIGLNLENGRISEYVERHPAQEGQTNAFAVRTLSDSMEPRYFKDELIYVHPGRYPTKGQDCVVEMTNGDAYVKQYLGETESHIKFGQFNPAAKFSWPKGGIKAIYAVLGRG